MSSHVYVIAEVGCNHNGSLELAKKMTRVASKMGVDCVKFQMFKTENLMTQYAPKAKYQLTTTDKSESQFDMTKKLELGVEDHNELVKICKECGVDYFATPFDSDSLHLLINKCNLNMIKIPSGEITNAPFLLEIAQMHRPVILSTGMSTLGEIEDALSILAYGYLRNDLPRSIDDVKEFYFTDEAQAALQKNVSLLHCTTEYPAPSESVNLKCMETMARAFHLPVGYSDHTEGIEISMAAVALGATIIEKHFTLDRSLPGPDQKASIEPNELKAMVNGIRMIEKAIGDGIKIPSVAERKNMAIARKSIVAKKIIKKGELLTPENLTEKRPGDGTSPFYYFDMVGTAASKDYEPDEKVFVK